MPAPEFGSAGGGGVYVEVDVSDCGGTWVPSTAKAPFHIVTRRLPNRYISNGWPATRTCPRSARCPGVEISTTLTVPDADNA